jgi:hypothetical protein
VYDFDKSLFNPLQTPGMQSKFTILIQQIPSQLNQHSIDMNVLETKLVARWLVTRHGNGWLRDAPRLKIKFVTGSALWMTQERQIPLHILERRFIDDLSELEVLCLLASIIIVAAWGVCEEFAPISDLCAG